MSDLDVRRQHKIVTALEYPPIPLRQYDWVAFRDGYEELGKYGYGRTEEDAIQALLADEAEEAEGQ